MGSIDDFWRQLNVKKGPKATLSGLSNIPGLTTHLRTLPAKGSASPSVPAPQLAAALAPSGLPDQQGLQVCNCQKDILYWQNGVHIRDWHCRRAFRGTSTALQTRTEISDGLLYVFSLASYFCLLKMLSLYKLQQLMKSVQDQCYTAD